MDFKATKLPVANRGVPPDGFLMQLVVWGRCADEEIFRPNAVLMDVYAAVRPQLGPWESIAHRRAAMLEVMRVLAGFESSWNWEEGVDTTNPTSNLPCTEEAGAWQVSGNAMAFDQSLRDLVERTIGSHDCVKFQVAMKGNHPFAMEFIARLLRFTIRHNGPVLRGEINPWLRRDAVTEFSNLLLA